jgi:hypothetical protein
VTTKIAWVSPTTLVTIDVWPDDVGPARLSIFEVRGTTVERTEHQIAATSWGDPSKIVRNWQDHDVAVTGRGELWIGMCVKQNQRNNCTRRHYARVYGGTDALRHRPPPDVVYTSAGRNPPLDSLAAVDPPIGHTASVRRGVIRCTSPTRKHVSTAAYAHGTRFVAERARWIRASPPILGVHGMLSEPAVGPYPYVQYFRGCKSIAYRQLRPRVWADESGGWRIWIDDKLVARLADSDGELAAWP